MKIIKKIWNVVFIILSISALIGFIIIPFLTCERFNILLQIIWYLSSAILLINVYLPRKNKEQKSNYTELPKNFIGILKFIGDSFSNVAGLSLVIFFSSMFIINNYELQFYDIAWMIFVLLVVVFIGSIYVIYKYRNIFNNYDDNQRKKNNMQMVVSMLFYILIDLLYIFIVKDVIVGQYIVGIIAILIIFYNSTKSFIKSEKLRIFSIVQDVLFGLSITTYLIFIIEDASLQTIVTSIVSAVFGGYITLLGVAWTIKDNNEKRIQDERNNKIPYLTISNDTALFECRSFNYTLIKAYTEITEKTKCLFLIDDFIIKNSQNSDCIPYGYMLNDKMFVFDTQPFIERNITVKIITTHNTVYVSELDTPKVSLVLKDVLGNFYQYECILKVNESRLVILDDDKHILEYNYKVVNIGLPKLLS
ncbi:MAG: hypothetical protein IJX78_08110 [Bacilli bacterium]|nr:hypothetical protein [Bacilli bacterium]